MPRVESLSSYRRDGESLAQTRERLRAVVSKADDATFYDWLRRSHDGQLMWTKAIEVFGDRTEARTWMSRPATALGGLSARELASSHDGRRQLLDYLERLSLGGYS